MPDVRRVNKAPKATTITHPQACEMTAAPSKNEQRPGSNITPKP